MKKNNSEGDNCDIYKRDFTPFVKVVVTSLSPV